MSRYGTLLGVFVGVVLLVVGAVAVGGLVFADESPEQAELDTSQWRLDNVSPDGATEGGEVVMESSEPTKTVVVHVGTPTGSGSSVLSDVPLQGVDGAITTGSAAGLERSVGTLLSTLVANGHEIEFYTGTGGRASFGEMPALSDDLADADAFVTTAPTALSDDDRNAITTFAGAGGRVFVGADPGQARGVVELGSNTGIYQETGYLYNVADNDQNYLSIFAEPGGSSSLTDGIERLVFRGAAPIGHAEADPVFVSGAETELTTTQRADTYGVAAVSDNVSVVGDTSFLRAENAYRADNNVLIGNVADYLVTGEVNETRLQETGGERLPPGSGGLQPPEAGDGPELPTDGNESVRTDSVSDPSSVNVTPRDDRSVSDPDAILGTTDSLNG